VLARYLQYHHVIRLRCAFSVISFQASFRHPIKWAAPEFYDPAALDKVHCGLKQLERPSDSNLIHGRKCAGYSTFAMAAAAASICVSPFPRCSTPSTILPAANSILSTLANSKKFGIIIAFKIYAEDRLTFCARRLRTNALSATCALSTSARARQHPTRLANLPSQMPLHAASPAQHRLPPPHSALPSICRKVNPSRNHAHPSACVARRAQAQACTPSVRDSNIAAAQNSIGATGSGASASSSMGGRCAFQSLSLSSVLNMHRQRWRDGDGRNGRP
jgi:hypothetical protein